MGSSFRNVPERSMTGISLSEGDSFSSLWSCALLAGVLRWLFDILFLGVPDSTNEASLAWGCCLLVCGCWLRGLFNILFLEVSDSTRVNDTFSSWWDGCLLWLDLWLFLHWGSSSFTTCDQMIGKRSKQRISAGQVGNKTGLLINNYMNVKTIAIDRSGLAIQVSKYFSTRTTVLVCNPLQGAAPLESYFTKLFGNCLVNAST